MTFKKEGTLYIVKTRDEVKITGSLDRATTYLGFKS